MTDPRLRKWLYTIAAVFTAATVGLLVASGASEADSPEVTVYRSPACTCCGGWIAHMEEAGFDVEVVEDRNLVEVKAETGVPGRLHSCHTAVLGPYVVEGHVPAGDVERLLRESPRVKGIAVAGMPAGSPGMPGTPEPYVVESFTALGSTGVWARH